MILTDGRKDNPRAILFGVNEADKSDAIVLAGMAYFGVDMGNSVELFDLAGVSWGWYSLPSNVVGQPFKVKTQNLSLAKKMD